MNKLIWILLLSFFLICCKENKQRLEFHPDLFFDNLKGSVEKTEEVPYKTESSGKTLTPDSCCTTILYYDSNGYRTRQVSTDMNGNEKYGQIYTRFPNGLVKELTITEGGKPVSTLISVLDKDGKYSSASGVDSSGKPEFFYSDILVNNYGKIISFKKYTPDSNFLQTVINNYKQQIWIGGSIKDSSGRELFVTSVELNKHLDPVVERESSEINGELKTTITRNDYTAWDKKGNWVEKNVRDDKGNIKNVIKRQISYHQ